MTQHQAEKTANILIGAAALGAAFFILRNPSVRRAVWRITRNAAATTGPVLIAEARRVWNDGGGRRETGDMMGG